MQTLAMQPTSKLQRLLNNEQSLFDEEYQQHFIDGETKPKAIGEPFLLAHPTSKTGVLLIHGLMAAPEEVREWGEFLFSQGYTVYAPRMSGHGTSAVDLAQREMGEWAESVHRGHEILKCCCDRIIIAGFSTGGAMALLQAIQHPNTFDAIISISAPLKFKKFSAHFAGMVNRWNCLSRFFGGGLGKEFITNHADNPHINYLRCPVSGIVQIQRLMKRVYQGLPSISIPTLIIHASGDPKVDVQSGRDIFKRIQSHKKTYREIDFHLHGIVRGEIAKDVFTEVEGFLRRETRLGGHLGGIYLGLVHQSFCNLA